MIADCFVIPFPPSVNAMWRTVNGRMILSAAGRKYRGDVAMAIYEHRREVPMPTRICKLKVILEVVRPDNRRRDLDNLLKGILDALQHAEVYEDDSQVHDLSIKWASPEPQPGGGVVVYVSNLP